MEHYFFRRGWQLPCGLSAKDSSDTQRRTEYADYKYSAGTGKHIPGDEQLMERAFIDPQTGAVYEGYSTTGRGNQGGGPIGYKLSAPERHASSLPDNACAHVYECPEFDTALCAPPPSNLMTGPVPVMDFR